MCIRVIIQYINKYKYVHIYAKEPQPPPFAKRSVLASFKYQFSLNKANYLSIASGTVLKMCRIVFSGERVAKLSLHRNSSCSSEIVAC